VILAPSNAALVKRVRWRFRAPRHRDMAAGRDILGCASGTGTVLIAVYHLSSPAQPVALRNRKDHEA
jgi:hypothetical protein